MAILATPLRNKLFSLLPKQQQQHILAHCEQVHFSVRDTLYEANKPMLHVYFPLSCVTSTVATMDNGMSVEVATTGNEGMVGLSLFLGACQTPLQTFVQVAGEALRLPAKEFHQHLQRESALPAVLQRFSQALMMQIAQTSACNRVHSIEQRCCRWLLMTCDRVGRKDFQLKQDFLAQMLGVKRATVGEIAGVLQAAKLIKYSRGLISLVNVRGLQTRSCGCYFVVRDEYEHLLSNFKSKR